MSDANFFASPMSGHVCLVVVVIRSVMMRWVDLFLESEKLFPFAKVITSYGITPFTMPRMSDILEMLSKMKGSLHMFSRSNQGQERR